MALTRESGAQMGLFDGKKTRGQKSRNTVPLIDIEPVSAHIKINHSVYLQK
jgi:hypothetical protein